MEKKKQVKRTTDNTNTSNKELKTTQSCATLVVGLLLLLFQQPNMDECKRSGQIPAFGNWDYANELPITQYFESARQAGLVRYSSSSGESDPYQRSDHDLYAGNMPPSTVKKAMRNRERRSAQIMVKDKESVKMNTRKQGKVCDVTEQARKPVSKEMHLHNAVPRSPPHRAVRLPKPVDEDLYKIPPELLRTTKRKKMLGFISKCLVPAACVS